jgi:UDP-N-acetylglucosamine:LPS N-acetylglucosamine transferase
MLNVNGSGMGHLNRCLSYALKLRSRAKISFFSLASAIEIIEEMGFEADYFVSHYWSSCSSYEWNSELAIRFGLILERVKPDVVVFDGTWPFQGFISACKAYGNPSIVWSNRGLLKNGSTSSNVDLNIFKLIIKPGELGSTTVRNELSNGCKEIITPPVCLLDEHQLKSRDEARKSLGLDKNTRYILFSLGSGNLKDIKSIGISLINSFEERGYKIIWAKAPISINDIDLPISVKCLTLYPLVRYLRAFDAFVGAAGYNTCCEVIQSGIPSLLVPNDQLVDDQIKRAKIVSNLVPIVVSNCETESSRRSAVHHLVKLMQKRIENVSRVSIPMNGAEVAADEIIALAIGGR